MTVTSRPPASRIWAAIWPKREKPIISTSAPAPSKSSSSSSLASRTISRFDRIVPSGVSAMLSVTIEISTDVVAPE